jgi:thiamine-phosphate pyrophosphorylase
MTAAIEIARLHVLVDSVALAEAALEGGAPCLQARVKVGNDRSRFEAVAAIVARCRVAGAQCIVDDRADFAVAAGADGVHVGASDLPVAAARAVVGPALLVGATVRDPVAAADAVAAGADYLGVGPVYVSGTKTGLPDPLGPAGLRRVVDAAAPVPVVAISGITAERAVEVLAAGAHGIAVIGAVTRASDPRAATRELLTVLAAAGEGVAS